MDETLFTLTATQELSLLTEALESADSEGVLDVECLDGVLSITLEDGREYVINKHTPSRKIWASSPLSGASYYIYDEATTTWHDTHAAEKSLRDMVADEIATLTGITIRFA